MTEPAGTGLMAEDQRGDRASRAPEGATHATRSAIIQAALRYCGQGMWVTPTLGKRPVLDDWPHTHLDSEEIRRTFRPEHNVGVILGASDLADLDLDDALAMKAYQSMDLPELKGAAVFEHAGRPHFIIKAQGVETRRFKRSDGSTLLEIRGDGAQTVFPPSVHPDGLPYLWVNECDPPEVEASRLQTLAAMIATASYASEFWSLGSRHDLALALAGFLARRLAEADILAVIRSAAILADDDEVGDREAAVATTVQRVRAGDPVLGLPTLENLAPELARSLASWWGPGANDQDKVELSDSRPSQADLLVDIGHTAELFHDASGAGFARLQFSDHSEIWPLKSQMFRKWLRREFYRNHKKAPNTDAVNSASGVLDGIASFDGCEYDLQNRVAWHDGAIYYDLADARWRAVRIDSDGWNIVEQPPVLFRRYAHQRPQVDPIVGGDLRLVFRFLNVRPDDQLLLLTWLVTAVIPNIPHPVPDFHGQKGSGKSVGQRVLRRLIDPSGAESLSFPSDVRELVQQLSHHYAPVYDNIDDLKPWLSDIICRAVTGEGFSKRELYSDDDDVIYSYRRVVMLNGVNVVARRPDLLDRTILIGLDQISRRERREEHEFWAAFEEARPHIFGGILDALSGAMRVYSTLKIPLLERMADFTRWGAAIAEALGYGADAFIQAYGSNIGVQNLEGAQGHIVGAAVLALMEGRSEWSGSPTELFAALEEAGEAAGLFKRTASGKVDARGWPGAAHILSRRLNEVRGNLADLGLEIREQRGAKRVWEIVRVAEEVEKSSVGSVSGGGLYPAGASSADATDAADAITPPSEAGGWEVTIP